MTEPDGAAARRVLIAASASDPSIEPGAAEPLALECLQLLQREPALDASELARRVVASDADADASWVVHIARAAVERFGDDEAPVA